MADERRLAICIKGGISLGAYEAGALTQTLAMIANHNTVQKKTNDGRMPFWYIDAFSGASAGAMTAFGTLLTLLDSKDSHLHEMWVTKAALSTLAPEHPGSDVDLSYTKGDTLLAASALDYLASDFSSCPARVTNWHGAMRPSGDTIKLIFTLSDLDGEPQPLDSLNGAPLGYREYADAMSWHVTIDGSGNVSVNAGDTCAVGLSTNTDSGSAWRAALQTAIAAGTFPLAFAQRGLYRKMPNAIGKYYTDGGMFDNDPVGKLINLVHDIDWSSDNPAYQDSQRRFLIVHTEPCDLSVPSHEPPYPTRDLAPLKFIGKLLPAFMNEQMQSGMRGITEVNRCLEQRKAILNRLARVAMQQGTLSGQPSFETVLSTLAEARKLTQKKFDKLRGFLIPDLRDLDSVLYDYVTKMPAPAQSFFCQLALLFDLSYDVADKVPIKPILIAPTGPLAGDPLYAFAGFFSRRLREFDFTRGTHDAFLAWKAISERPEHEFTIDGIEEPPPGDFAQATRDAVSVPSEYQDSADQFKKRIKAVVSRIFDELGESAQGHPLAKLYLYVLHGMADLGVGSITNGSD